ncbi:MAG: hypothetical protein LBH62_05305 [Nitrososphaerota archaeon]|jgi:hypothetical protein|nr:hypothetical protein [Nitrososphaerota archaeon]
MSPNEKISLKEDPNLNLSTKKEIVTHDPICGIDIAKDEIVATILTDNFKQTRKSGS